MEVYKNGDYFIGGSKWLNHEFIFSNPDYAKSTKQALLDSDKAFRRFFKGEANFPNLKN